MALCLKQKIESANRFMSLIYIIHGLRAFFHAHFSSIMYTVQRLILELCRPLSKQFHATHHSFDDTAINAHLVSWHEKLSLPSFASLQFDAHVRNIANLDFSIYWSFMISAGLELPADLLSIIGLEQLGRYVWLFSSLWTTTSLVELRRWSSNLSLLGSGIAILPCAWLTVS